MRKWMSTTLLATAGALAAFSAGCQSTLETGYKPTPLDASDSQRRAFYAPAYSPQMRAAQEDPAKGTNFHQNTQGY